MYYRHRRRRKICAPTFSFGYCSEPNKAADAHTPAVDYHAVVCRLRLLAEESRHGLMEDFAEETAAVLLREFDISRVRVYCRKPKPLAGLAEAGVEIIRSRSP